MTSGSAHDAKAALRPVLVAVRRELVSARDRAADDTALARQVLALTTTMGIGAGGTVAAYDALPSEPPTVATIGALTADGIRVIVPITLPDRDLDWCVAGIAGEGRQVPLGLDAIGAAALVLTPGLAADRAGTRLGRGGGSYDRALARRGSGARVLVVLHPGELRPDLLPADPHDQPVHGVLTADGVTWL